MFKRRHTWRDQYARTCTWAITLRGHKELLHAEQRVINWEPYLNKEDRNGGMKKGMDREKDFVNAIRLLMVRRILTPWRRSQGQEQIQSKMLLWVARSVLWAYIYVSALDFHIFSSECELSMMHITVLDGSGYNKSLWEHFLDILICSLMAFHNKSMTCCDRFRHPITVIWAHIWDEQ